MPNLNSFMLIFNFIAALSKLDVEGRYLMASSLILVLYDATFASFGAILHRLSNLLCKDQKAVMKRMCASCEVKGASQSPCNFQGTRSSSYYTVVS